MHPLDLRVFPATKEKQIYYGVTAPNKSWFRWFRNIPAKTLGWMFGDEEVTVLSTLPGSDDVYLYGRDAKVREVRPFGIRLASTVSRASGLDLFSCYKYTKVVPVYPLICGLLEGDKSSMYHAARALRGKEGFNVNLPFTIHQLIQVLPAELGGKELLIEKYRLDAQVLDYTVMWLCNRKLRREMEYATLATGEPSLDFRGGLTLPSVSKGGGLLGRRRYGARARKFF
jgi:hypothetical protein